MRPTVFKLTAIILILSGIAQTTSAQSDGSINVVTTAVPFLRISPDARAAGMGDLALATSPDANASFWNLAKVPFNTSLRRSKAFALSLIGENRHRYQFDTTCDLIFSKIKKTSCLGRDVIINF